MRSFTGGLSEHHTSPLRSVRTTRTHWISDGKFITCRSRVRNARIAVMGINDGERLQLEVQKKR